MPYQISPLVENAEGPVNRLLGLFGISTAPGRDYGTKRLLKDGVELAELTAFGACKLLSILADPLFAVVAYGERG